MRSRAPLSAATAALALFLSVGLAACGDDEAPSPSRSDDATTAPTGTATDGSAPTETASAESTVAPATGQLFSMQTFDIHLLEGLRWDDGTHRDVVATSAITDVGLVNVILSSTQSVTDDWDLNARTVFDLAKSDRLPLKRAGERTIDGQRAYVYTARPDGDDRYYHVGGLADGYSWEIKFDYPDTWPDAEEHIEAMLASVSFHAPATIG